jgi:4-hydroxybutyryl-CoA dehydratase/vinylacetyl-CoA-Delta-isomerase
MTRREYRESLRDGRTTFWDGDSIADITTHPNFRVPLEVAERDYAYDDAKRRDILTYQTETGEVANRVFQIPTSEAELLQRLELAAEMSIVGGVTGVFMALMSVRDEVGEVNPRYAENIQSMYHYARDRDLRAAEVITDAKGDRSRRAHEQDDPDLYLHIVERGDDGIVVRGAKFHITAASLVHEQVVMPTKSMRNGEEDYAVAFSIPTGAPGLKIINRSFAPPELNPFDYPASAHHSIPEGMVIFDDVFVPWDRVFLAGETPLSGVFARSLGLWERTLGLLEAAERAELMVGLAQLVVEHQGKERKPEAMNAISELICYAHIIRTHLEASCRRYESTPSGMVHPNILDVNVGKYYFAANYHTAVRHLQDIAGGLVLTLPKEADLRNPESGAYIRKYLHAKQGTDVEDRMRILNLIRDLTADAFGGWHLVTSLQAGGGLIAQRIMMNRTYDIRAAARKAMAAAGVRDA